MDYDNSYTMMRSMLHIGLVLVLSLHAQLIKACNPELELLETGNTRLTRERFMEDLISINLKVPQMNEGIMLGAICTFISRNGEDSTARKPLTDADADLIGEIMNRVHAAYGIKKRYGDERMQMEDVKRLVYSFASRVPDMEYFIWKELAGPPSNKETRELYYVRVRKIHSDYAHKLRRMAVKLNHFLNGAEFKLLATQYRNGFAEIFRAMENPRELTAAEMKKIEDGSQTISDRLKSEVAKVLDEEFPREQFGGLDQRRRDRIVRNFLGLLN